MRIPLLVSGPRDYDEGVYWLSVRRLVHGDALFGSVYSSQPPFFLPLLTPFYRLFGEGLTSLRMASVVLGVVGVLAGAWTAGRLGGRAAAVLTAVLLSIDPLMILTGTTVLAEGPALDLALVATALAAEATQPRSWRRPQAQLWLSFAAGAAAAAAVGVKLLALPVLIPVAILVTARIDGSPPWRRLAAAGGGAVVVAAAALAAFRSELHPLLQQSIGLHLDSRSLDEGGFTGDLWATARRELPLVVLAAVGAVRTLAMPARRRAGSAITLWAVAGVAAVALQHPLWPHHVSAIVPPLAVLGGLALATPIPRARGFAATVALAGVAACVLSAVTYYWTYRPAGSPGGDDHVVADLRAHVPPGSLVVSDDQTTVAQAGLDAPPELVDTSLVRINSGNLSTADVERIIERDNVRAVLFGTTRLEHLPGLQDWVANRLPVRVGLGEGRVLYLGS